MSGLTDWTKHAISFSRGSSRRCDHQPPRHCMAAFGLPGPTLTVDVIPLKVERSTAGGCTIYEFRILHSTSVENTQFLFQIPGNILSYRIGSAQQTLEGANGASLWAAGFVFGRDSKGVCSVLQMSQFSDNPNVRIRQTGLQAVQIDIDKLPANTQVVGAIASKTRTIDSAQTGYIDGTYEYESLGQSITKRIGVITEPLETYK